MRTNLLVEHKLELLKLLTEYNNVFAWIYIEMPGVDSQLVLHQLNIKEGTRPINQAARKFKLEWEVQIKQQIQRLYDFGWSVLFSTHPVSSILPVKKKNSQTRSCIDFWNLDKACPNDEFLLVNIGMLVDVTIGHSMFSFIDDF